MKRVTAKAGGVAQPPHQTPATGTSLGKNLLLMLKHDAPSSPLRKWREANGLTLEEEGALTGLSASFLSRVERGERRLRPATKLAIARGLGVPLRDLFPIDGPA